MGDHYHFIGIGGIGMSGLARILLAGKQNISGSDIAYTPVIEGLIHAGVSFYHGHAAGRISPRSIVVYGSDIRSDNPEYQAALALGSPLLHRADLLQQLAQAKRAFAVAGTHGKTTVSSLLATVMIEAGSDPSFAVGGVVASLNTNAYPGKGNDFVFEADESDGSFLKYRPFGAIVTNIDNDHLIHYQGSEQILIDAFRTFIDQVVSSEHLFWSGDDPYLRTIASRGNSYGFHPSCTWQILSLKQVGFRSFIDLRHQDQYYDHIEIALTGKHNALNATAVFGSAITLGLKESDIRESLKTFKGVHRRCEQKGEAAGVLVIDDYAHHPSAIRTTLSGLRQAEPGRRLIAVFQPHRYTRTKDCLGMFGSAFNDADALILTDIYPAGEMPIPGISNLTVFREVCEKSAIPCSYISRMNLSVDLVDRVQSNDLLVTLGAGDITHVGSELIDYLHASRKKGKKR